MGSGKETEEHAANDISPPPPIWFNALSLGDNSAASQDSLGALPGGDAKRLTFSFDVSVCARDGGEDAERGTPVTGLQKGSEPPCAHAYPPGPNRRFV